MIKNFVKVFVKEQSKGSVKISQETKKSFVLNFPCTNANDCTPYKLEIAKGVYKFECWGSKGETWYDPQHGQSTPGSGGYTAGTIFFREPTTIYVYIGAIGFFNSVKEMKTSNGGFSGGGATDVRLNSTTDWYETSSLISRIMVAGGGGGAEWAASIGGNGGGLQGGESISAKKHPGTEVFNIKCQGAQQTQGTTCNSLTHGIGTFSSSKGTFGSAGNPSPVSIEGRNDYGAYGGGGFYGGTSYPYSFSGSGGSSYISGYIGCKAVKNQIDPIAHINDSVHYSGFVFSNPEMIPGNQTMPLPTLPTGRGKYNDIGAFRITLIQYQYQCTLKRRLFLSFLHSFSLFILFK